MAISTTKTVFCRENLALWDGLEFVVDGNSKITAENGSMEEPKPNAFSLPHISTCPGSTTVCRSSCYVHGLQKHAQETYQTYVQNERVLHRVLMSSKSSERAASILAEFIQDTVTSFRWHVSGDIFSTRHAEWIDRVCDKARDVTFWIYTRSFDALPYLEADNLVVNLSADSDNLEAARVAQREYGGRICYLSSEGETPDLPRDSVLFPDYKLRGRDLDEPTEAPWWQGLEIKTKRQVCPADFFGQSEQHRCGPCNKCMKPWLAYPEDSVSVGP